MTTATTAAVLLAAAYTTASATASVDMLADPQGNGNVDVLMGTDATQQDASSWRTMDDAPAVWTAWNGWLDDYLRDHMDRTAALMHDKPDPSIKGQVLRDALTIKD